MDFEFDKEIDALLRQSARGEAAFDAANPNSSIQNPPSLHLDADEISAFAENALPEKARQQYVSHLADCDKCRRNLSSLILLNAEQSSEIAHADEKQIVASPIPWYRKLFAVPNLAYTLGALVLVFSGIAAYTVLQNAGNPQNSEVSQTFEKQPGGKGMSSDGDALPTESYSANTMMSNAASMNMSSNTSASVSNSAMPSAPTAAMNANAATMTRDESDKNLKAESKSAAPNEPRVLAETRNPAADSVSPKENNFQLDGEREKQLSQNSVAQRQDNRLPSAGSLQSAPLLKARAADKSKKAQDSKDDAQKTTAEAVAETTSVGGKTFKRTNNVWYDSAYRGQTTTNVTRGTNEYKKLDSGLRGIVGNLGGTIVVVWKEKAYRIQ